MTVSGSNERDELLEAVNTLVDEVKELNDKLALYAPREEVRRTIRTKAWRFFGAASVVILISQLLSMATISYCFLDANSTEKIACTAIPGYHEAVNQNDIRLARFNALLDGQEGLAGAIESNNARLDLLEKRIDQLEKNGGGK